jgi:hypothetical protein
MIKIVIVAIAEDDAGEDAFLGDLEFHDTFLEFAAECLADTDNQQGRHTLFCIDSRCTCLLCDSLQSEKSLSRLLMLLLLNLAHLLLLLNLARLLLLLNLARMLLLLNLARLLQDLII